MGGRRLGADAAAGTRRLSAFFSRCPSSSVSSSSASRVPAAPSRPRLEPEVVTLDDSPPDDADLAAALEESRHSFQADTPSTSRQADTSSTSHQPDIPSTSYLADWDDDWGELEEEAVQEALAASRREEEPSTSGQQLRDANEDLYIPQTDNAIATAEEMGEEMVGEMAGDGESLEWLGGESVVELPPEDLSAETATSWVYPEGSEAFPTRSYQKTMTREALLSNSLVCLPTGLGKTLIAAVVMLNYHRWYPQGKIVFLCPTRPLVDQQIQACYQIMASIPQTDLIDLTGARAPKLRVQDWQEHRVFFMTPQTMVSDLKSGACPIKTLRCLVFDEAHRAQGGHAYCEIMRYVQPQNNHFRVLALSATPGNDMKAVEGVVINLAISRIDQRTEQSLDVAPYVQSCKLEELQVAMTPELRQIKDLLEDAIRGTLRSLVSLGALYSDNVGAYGAFKILMLSREYRNPDKGRMGRVKTTFAFAVSMYHLHDLLVRFGTRTLYAAIKAKRTDPKAKSIYTRMSNDPVYHRLMRRLEDNYAELRNVSLDSSVNFAGSLDVTQAPPPLEAVQSEEGGQLTVEDEQKAAASHPKLPRLKRLLLDHFAASGEDSRVMVFSTFRNSVSEIVDYLKRFRPTLRPVEFKGQSGGGVRSSSSARKRSSEGAKRGPEPGQSPAKKRSRSSASPAPTEADDAPAPPKPTRTTQKRQLEIIRQFKEGVHNILVSTSVGEEGLDIGEVDLSVLFDAPRSSIRLVQRSGRTGRKREGRIVVLLTEGQEVGNYHASKRTKERVRGQMAASRGRANPLPFVTSPRLLPPGRPPQCQLFPVPLDRPTFDPDLYKPRRLSAAKAKEKLEAKAKEKEEKLEAKAKQKEAKEAEKTRKKLEKDLAKAQFKEPKPPPKRRSAAAKAKSTPKKTDKQLTPSKDQPKVEEKPEQNDELFLPEHTIICIKDQEFKRAQAESMMDTIGAFLDAPIQPLPSVGAAFFRRLLVKRRAAKVVTEMELRTEKETPPLPRPFSPLELGFDFNSSMYPSCSTHTAAPPPAPRQSSEQAAGELGAREKEAREKQAREDKLDLGFDFFSSPSPAESPESAVVVVSASGDLDLGLDFFNSPSPSPLKAIRGSLDLGFDFNDPPSPKATISPKTLPPPESDDDDVIPATPSPQPPVESLLPSSPVI